MEKRLFCVRGATCAENNRDSIQANVCEMVNSLVEKNCLKTEDIVSFQFTITPDLDVMNPATALRLGKCNVKSSSIPLFCSAEPVIKGMLPRVVRIMITAYADEGSVMKSVYIHGAEALRPDLSSRQ